MKKLLVYFLLLLVKINLFTQNREIHFENIIDGLTNLRIHCMIQDSKGFVWIGNALGFQRYDGYNFISYRNKPGDTNSLCCDIVLSIAEDNRGLLWIGTEFGLSVFNPESEQFIQYFHKPGISSTIWDYIYVVFHDKEDNIWLGTGRGLVRFTSKNIKVPLTIEHIFTKGINACFDVSHYTPYKNDTTAWKNKVNTIYEDNNNNLWTGGFGLFIFDRKNNEFYRLDNGPEGITRLTNSEIKNILEETNGTYWIGTVQGLNKMENVSSALSGSVPDKTKLVIKHYYPESEIRASCRDRYNNIWFGFYGEELKRLYRDVNGETTFESFRHDLSDPKNIGYAYILSMMVDKTGVIWTGHMAQGISKFHPRGFQFISQKSILKKPENINNVWPVYEDSLGYLWIGTFDAGLYKINTDNGEVIRYKSNKNLSRPANKISALLDAGKGIIWIGTWGNGIFKFDAHDGTFQEIESLSEDLNMLTHVYSLFMEGNYLLIGTWRNGLFILDTKKNELAHYLPDKNDSLSIRSNTIISICKTSQERIWLGTFEGLNELQLDKETGRALFLLPPKVFSRTHTNFSHKIIVSMREDKNGFLWVITGRGLNRFSPETGDVVKYANTGNYLGLQIQEDNTGNIWIGTRNGLCRFDTTTKQVTEFTLKDGLPIRVVNSNGSFFNKHGKMYIGGIGGFYSFYPDSIKINESIPEIVITDFKIFNESVQASPSEKAILTRNIAYMNEIELKYNQNDISFEFAALDYNDPERNRYAYKLEGYHKDWVYTDAKNHKAGFTNLDPGKYIFHVKGSNNHGIWNEEGTSLRIIIYPPWWKTTLAYGMYIVFFILLLYSYIRWRTWILRKEKDELEKQVKERTVLIQEANEELLQQKEELQTTLENLQKTQDQLIESEKMAALGGLVAGVAHEINTPVGITITAASGLIEETKKMADLYKENKISRAEFKDYLNTTNQSVKLILSNMERTATMIQSFKQVSVDQSTESKRTFKLKAYTEDVIRSLYPKLKNKKIHINMDIDEELEIDSYPGAYSQILTNLVLNSITHGFDEKHKGKIELKVINKNGELILEYKDNGKGISKENQKKIFNPFFTTNKKAGTGLGMHIVYNLVTQKLKGNIECNSKPGEGVLFKIQIPLK